MTTEARVIGVRLLGNIATFRAGPEWRKGDRVYSASELAASQEEVARLRGALEGLVSLALSGESVLFTAEYDRAREALGK